MHRSGSSLLVELLQKLGVFMGSDLEENNESMFFNRINEWLLRQAGASWDNPENFNYINENFENLMLQIIRQRLQSRKFRNYSQGFEDLQHKQSKAWGWKDPRNTFTLPMWRKIFPGAKIIHIYRNPVDVVASIAKRESAKLPNPANPTRTGLRKKFYALNLPKKRLYFSSFKCLDYEAAFRLWKEYIIQADEISQTTKTLSVSFENLLENPNAVSQQLADFLGTGPYPDINDFLSGIDNSRKFAFTNDESLIHFYKSIQDDELLAKFGYDNILSDGGK